MAEPSRSLQKAVLLMKFSGNWETLEDIVLVKLFLKIGKKWSKVAQNLGNHRTEHMVKNRYKTIIGRQKRFFPHIKDENVLLKYFLT